MTTDGVPNEHIHCFNILDDIPNYEPMGVDIGQEQQKSTTSSGVTEARAYKSIEVQEKLEVCTDLTVLDKHKNFWTL
ncbi:hypothetical protein G6F57_022440 [Rhizopus arrhizus]|nr:hypothetical protein G6F57_022440 [Rhizopus arrhizus]